MSLPPLPARDDPGARRRLVAGLVAVVATSVCAGAFLAAAVRGNERPQPPPAPAHAPAAVAPVAGPSAVPVITVERSMPDAEMPPPTATPRPPTAAAAPTPPPASPARPPARARPASPVPKETPPKLPPVADAAQEPPPPPDPERPEVQNPVASPRISPGPPPTAVIPAADLPDAARARDDLKEVRDRAAAGSTLRAEVDWLLRLADLYGGDNAAAGRRATVERALRANAWWFSGRGVPERAVVLRDPDGILLTHRAGYGFMVNPVATTGRWQKLNSELTAAQLAELLLAMGVPERHGDRVATVWEYFDVPTDPRAIRPGASGMAQARVAQVMANAWAQTGDLRFVAAARQAVVALTIPVDAGGVRAMVADPPGSEPSVWFPERAYPDTDPWAGAALNGFMVTILNLRGTASALRAGPPLADAAATAALADALSQQAAATLERFLPAHDTGDWSLYGLNTPGRELRNYRADLNYHCYHIRLLRHLAVAYPDAGFAARAEQWAGYVARVRLECPARP